MNVKRLQNCFRKNLALLLLGSTLASHTQSFGVTFIVNNNADSGPGSLRRAIEDSNVWLGSNTIVIAALGTIELSSGELLITNNANLIGPGVAHLTLQANYSSRVFHIVNAGATISDMTIARGSNSLGGGILLESSTLNLVRSTVTQNKALNGGGLAQSSGTMSVIDSTISSNSAAGTGMGIYIQGNATASVRRCTLAGNSGIGFTPSGGGISHSGTSLLVDTCTFCANGSTGGNGGGILNNSGNLAITNCTLFGNHSFVGGGVAAMAGTVTIRNSILAANTSLTGAAAAPDCYGNIISGGFNLVGNRTNSTGWGAVGDLIGTTAGPIDPMLGPLNDNGGYTWTMAPLLGSPVIDHGHSSGATVDQRGQPRPFDQPQVPNGIGGDGADIGAFEGNPKQLLVTTVNDFGPGSLRQAIADAAAQELTQIDFAPDLETNLIVLTNELVLNKNLIINGPGASVMGLVAVPGSRALHVVSGTCSISKLMIRDCQVTGAVVPVETDGTDVYGAGILNESVLNLTDMVISNNVIKGGKGGNAVHGIGGEGGGGRGGGVANFGVLSLTRCILARNFATGGDGGDAGVDGQQGSGGPGVGAGIYSTGNAFLTNSCIHSGLASGGNGFYVGSSGGGGIYNFPNTLSLLTCTVASNRAVYGYGGGICDLGSNGVYRSTTIAGNQGSIGGGIYASGSDFGNTLIAANVGSAGPDMNGRLFSSDYNLFQTTNGAVVTGSLTHTLRTFPFLGPLQDNGGPTPTMALLPGSPAIDQGKNFGIATDQRGRRRPFYFGPFSIPSGGDGSDIGAYELLGAFLHIARAGTNVVLSWPTNEPSLKLQSANFLTPYGPSPWANVPGTPAVSGNQFIMLEPMAQKKFYRLSGF